MLDVMDQNQLRIAVGKGTRNEQLAEYFMRAAGIASVWIDPDGHVGSADVARIGREAGQIVYCCGRGAHYVLGYRLWIWRQEMNFAIDQAGTAAALERLAAQGEVGITPHALAVTRAMDAVATVNQAIEAMTASGQMRDFNRVFKSARKVDPKLRYHDYLHSRKAAMLEAIAKGADAVRLRETSRMASS
ncbi:MULTISPECIES: hypothetical protein [unclassified Bradyrhizobium]|uniref:hypothetical protein n=1 Tax=unclassified Bradyrhizobium TaxID=2631580 RepID=UPI002916FCFC|nr:MULTISPECIES: hypothetical protein [unclassified Bradyrhizobium]